MSTTNVYDVTWHWEVNGRPVSNIQQDIISCADNKYDTIKGVIVTNQGKSYGGGTFVIDNVANVGPPSIEQ